MYEASEREPEHSVTALKCGCKRRHQEIELTTKFVGSVRIQACVRVPAPVKQGYILLKEVASRHGIRYMIKMCH